MGLCLYIYFYPEVIFLYCYWQQKQEVCIVTFTLPLPTVIVIPFFLFSSLSLSLSLYLPLSLCTLLTNHNARFTNSEINFCVIRSIIANLWWIWLALKIKKLCVLTRSYQIEAKRFLHIEDPELTYTKAY